ncbi:5'-nucleotidase [Rhodococcus sp. IEGM 1330]|uniref:5'-nucleotidase n=1 Tax=Rhodococcus sp. IEGM 1330 TaxID=3082225 RepID=UPI002954B7FB|nr:5'-nucleotidase [Rhodococcus sp. IEGM 1330]MDV8022209.1 5'-nucleotidase [Rhodococcus sp. IEGM 1330]
MAYDLGKRLVIGVASSALFDLSESDAIFRSQGEAAYRQYQQENLDIHLGPGVAFPFVRRILSLNDLSESQADPLVEVMILSHNDPDTGLRVMRSVAHHKLGITRSIFTQGKSPYDYIPVLNISLFLSANAQDVQRATENGYPAGRVLDSEFVDDQLDLELRIAFDFDAVLADDESERVMEGADLDAFHSHETQNLAKPHTPGPLKEFLVGVSRLQLVEARRKAEDPTYITRLRVSIVTARNAPSHERALATLKSWEVLVNDAFFLGGIEKAKVLQVLKPHIFFDDQTGHLEPAAKFTPSVHIPFGIRNLLQPSTQTSGDGGVLQSGEPTGGNEAGEVDIADGLNASAIDT